MIASPSDVPVERQMVRDVLAEWTAVHAVDRSAVLIPVSWESHAAPEMGDRPQGIINRRLLSDCDLLIAVFWTRIGSPTGEAESGTVEEIEAHIAAGKEAMIYFSDAPVRPDSVDPEQYEKLKLFKASCQARGLYESYESIAEFRQKLSWQLAVTMIRLTAAGPEAASLTLAVEAEVVVHTHRAAQMSPEARQLLKNASLDKNGMFMRVNVFGGAIVQANGRQLNEQGDARALARWDAALDELEREGLAKASGYKREIFQVTNEGYEAADHIAL